MDGLRFASPYALLLLLIAPALAVYAIRARRASPAILVGTVAPATRTRRTWRIRLEQLLPALRVLAVVLLVLAVARPQAGHAEIRSSGEGIDIVLGFDVSSSMSEPFAGSRSRLEVATNVLSQFVEARQRDRVGLVAFQGLDITLSPLTTDYAAMDQSVKSAGSLRLKDGTAIGLAIADSVALLRDSSAPSRIVILLTDGENNEHQIEPLAAARIAQSLGVRVYTVGVVSRLPGRPQFTSDVDEESLRQIASVTGGTYNRAEDPDALSQIYGNIDQLEKARIEGKVFTRYDEYAPYVLAAAAALIALEFALRYALLRRMA